jgi:hypothetical protein
VSLCVRLCRSLTERAFVVSLSVHLCHRLQQEVDSAVGVKSVLVEADLPNLPYMDAVIRETLRLYPPAPLTFREVKEDTMVGGYMAPAGSHICVSNLCVCVYMCLCMHLQPHPRLRVCS